MGDSGESRAGRQRRPISSEIPFDPKIGRESRQEMGIRVDWGVFMAHSRFAPRHIKSNFPGPNDDDATPVANCDSMAAPRSRIRPEETSISS